MKKLLMILTACVSFILAGCAHQPPTYAVNDPEIRSILIVPVVNETHEVLAGNMMMSTMSWPLAERGYYTFPVNTVRFVLEQEGFYEPEKVHDLHPTTLANMFGTDAILYAKVTFWDATYMVFSTRTQVTVDFYMYSKTGEKLFETSYTQFYQPNNNANAGLAGLIADMITAAMQRALPNYLPLANMINARLLTNFAPGPYLPQEVQGTQQVQK